VELDGDVHLVADGLAYLSYRSESRFEVRVGDALATGLRSELVEGPDLHRGDALVEQRLGQ